MNSFDPFKTHPGRLAALLGPTLDPRDLWRAEELSALWQHQLASRLEVDLGPSSTPTAAGENTPRTFADLLFDPHPDLDRLDDVKRFAKAHWNHPESPLPGEIATALYFTSIVAARRAGGRSLTTLDPASLQEGIRRVLAWPWLDDATRRLLGQVSEDS